MQERFYEPSAPRTTLGLAAVAMTALTIGTLVVMPAELETETGDSLVRAEAGASMKPTDDVAAVGSARLGAGTTFGAAPHVDSARSNLDERESRVPDRPSGSRRRTHA